MKNKESTGLYRLVIVLLVFAVALLGVGVLLKTRMGALLTKYSENQTRLQAETYAGLAAQKLQTQLDDLAYIAERIEKHPEELDMLMPVIYDGTGIKQGLLTIDGQAIYGESLLVRSFTGIQASFRGNSAITFVENEGLLFTCPVFRGRNIKYVLYRLFQPNALGESFSIDCYDGKGKLCVMTRDSQIIIPFADETEQDNDWFDSETIRGYYASMLREMEVSLAVAKTFSTDRGDMVFFEAELPDSDYLIAGYVPKEVAAEGIENINLLVMWVFGLLAVLVLIGVFYLTIASMKLRESNALREAKAMAEEASRAKSDFLANMSHEIRTPINAVLGMNEMILRETNDNTILTYARNIKNAGGTLLGLINDILDFSKIEAGKIEIIPVDYDLTVVINDLMNMIHTRADEKGLLMELEIDREIPRFLNGDEIRIRQIITNILTNAVKYTERGSVTLIMSHEAVSGDPNSIMLKVAVKDTGIGIKYEDMKKLFSEFERIEEKRNRNIEGTGLGMSITKSLLDLMGSSLEADSIYGLGSTFSFSVKQKVTGSEVLGDYEEVYRAQAGSQGEYKEKLTAPDANVLVVDDNPMNLMVFKSLIKQTLINVDTANDGDEGIRLASQKKYDMIFLDHMMPGKDGIDTLHVIRQDPGAMNPATPAVCLTANAISGAREKYIEAGFDNYLTKPIDPDKLENMLIEYLPKDRVKMTAADEDTPGTAGSVELPEELTALEGQDAIDVSVGLKNSGTVEAYMPLLKVFFETIDEKAEELDRFAENGDFDGYTIKVHALKSSARIIGATQLGEEAQTLEDAGKSGEYDNIKESHGAFIEKYRSFKDILSGVFPEAGNAGKPEADADLMNGVYEEVLAAAQDMDCDRLDSIFAEMEDYSIPVGEEALYNKLRQAAGNFDYDSIVNLLKNE